MSYVPAGKVESTKPPVSFVLTSRDSLVSRWVTFTVASGTAAPEASVTLPTIEPKRTCASACRPVLLAGRRRRAARRHRFGDLPDQHHRAGAGLGIRHRADCRQRARRLDGARPRFSRRYRQYVPWRRGL